MIAFHISGIVVLTLLINGVAIETIYNKLWQGCQRKRAGRLRKFEESTWSVVPVQK